MEEQTTDKQPDLKQDDNTLEELNLNELGTPEEIAEATQPKPSINVRGSEEISLEFNGVKIALGSSRIDVATLSNLALGIFEELKKNKENGGRSYV